MKNNLLKHIWPANCLPTKIYVILFAISLIGLIVQFAILFVMIRKVSQNIAENRRSRVKSVLIKAFLASLVSSMLSFVINVIIFNLLCGKAGQTGRQWTSGILGFAVLVPTVNYFIYGAVMSMFIQKEGQELLAELMDSVAVEVKNKMRPSYPEPSQPLPAPEVAPAPPAPVPSDQPSPSANSVATLRNRRY